MTSGPMAVTALVVAKAPVPGLAKTRLAATVGPEVAADIAAAALLDTLDAVAESPFSAFVVAFTGDLSLAARSDEIRTRLEDFTVIGQRGADFSHRLAHAHADAAGAGAGSGSGPILQIGMDTPQLTAELLTDCANLMTAGTAVLGPARDGGWWALGLSDASVAGCLTGVPMSRSDTGALTAAALARTGARVVFAAELADVDTIDDVPLVRAACRPASRFALATEGI